MLKTAVSVTVLPSTLFVLSIHSASGGRTGNSVLITVNTDRFLSSPQDSLKALAFQTLVFLTDVTPVWQSFSTHGSRWLRAPAVLHQKTKDPNAEKKLRGDQKPRWMCETLARAQDHIPAAHFASYNFSHRPLLQLQIHGRNWSPSRLAG